MTNISRSHLGMIVAGFFITLVPTLCAAQDGDTGYGKTAMDKKTKKYYTYGKLTGEEGITLGDSKKSKEPYMPHNPVLYRSALDVLSFMPLASSDALGGVVLSDWFTDPKTPNQRYKVIVRIMGAKFHANNVKVIVHKQTRSNEKADWAGLTEDAPTATQLEDLIVRHGQKAMAAQGKKA